MNAGDEKKGMIFQGWSHVECLFEEEGAGGAEESRLIIYQHSLNKIVVRNQMKWFG